MALPTPRSFSQILGQMINTFLTRLGLPSIKTGDPSLSIMEAAAQSDFRSTQDVFQNLTSQYLDGSTGQALDRKGRDERVARISQTSATGRVTISDTSFSKIETQIYQGGTGVTAGSTTISVESAIPTNGNLYLGRGTANAEGPIAYTTVVASGSFFVITLSTATQNYHQTGEKVTYAQGGDRLISAGTVVSTPTSSAGLVVTFRTLFNATILDGEVTLENIDIEAQQPGAAGNVGAGAINTFATSPFSGAAVTNPLPLSNGTDTENEDTYRERIRLAKKSRAKAIKDAIVYGLVGARALDESGSIISVSTSFRNGEPRTLYIDDGTGYQEKDTGIISESLIDSALGGERFFSLSNRPVAKAYLKTRNSAPFTVVPNSTLTLSVGGVETSHSFGAAAFRDVNNASAYEVASSVNSNGALNFAARVVDAGSKVAFYGKEESQEDIEWIAAVGTTDANDWLQLPLERAYTLYLYKNDVLLYEDGRTAFVESRAQGDWGVVATGATLNITVDDIASTVTFNDIDFINAGTSFTNVNAANSLQSWVDVFNYKIAGITATVNGGKITITSNLGRSNRASVSITGGTLGAAFFGDLANPLPLISTGLVSDYSLDRNSSNIKLASPLVAGDRLVCGSAFTNGFLSATINTLTLAANAEFWFVVDGNPTFPVTSIGSGTSLTWAVSSSPAWGDRITITGPANTWSNTEEGDWLIITDSAVAANAKGIFRIAEKISSTVIHIERATGSTVGTVTLSEGGVYVVRSSAVPQTVTIPAAANYTPTSLAVLFSAVAGITATPISTVLRLSTNNSTGDISIVAANPTAISMGFPFRSSAQSGLSHQSYIQTGNSELGSTTAFGTLTAVTSTTRFTAINAASYVQTKFLRPLPDGSNLDRRNNQDVVRVIESNPTATESIVRTAAPKEWLVGDRVALSRGFDITPRDNLQLLIDNDTVSGRYNTDMFRKVSVVAAGAGTMELSEVGGLSLARAFGTGFDWKDFKIAMLPRVKSHSSPDTTKTILWRWWRHEDYSGVVQYQYPKTPSTGITIESDTSTLLATVRLGSGAVRAVPTFRTSSKIGVAITNLAASLYTYQFVANLNVTAAAREIRINYVNRNATAFAPAAVVTGSLSGATATVSSDSNPGAGVMASGYIVVTGVAGTFLPNETITTGGGASATTTTSIYGYTTLTVALPGAVTNHGLTVGTTIYFTPGDANFLPGARQVAAVAATTVSYVDTVATTAAAGAIGTVSNDVAGEVTLNGTTVVTGDIFSSTAATALPTVFQKALKITLDAGNRGWTAQHYQGQAVNTVLAWYSQNGSTFFPLDAVANTASNIAPAVNAIANSPVTAWAVGAAGVATGIVTDATYETTELGGATPFWVLTNTTGWIQSHNTPATINDNFIFTLRDGGLPAILTTNADLTSAREDVRIVPTTASNVARWLNSTAVSGLANRGGAFVLDNGSVQIRSNTQGSGSSVQVTGGSANSAGATVQGAVSTGSLLGATYSVVKINRVDGIGDAQLLWAQNAIVNTKPVFGSTTKLTSINVNGTVTLDNTTTKAWTSRNTADDDVPILVERVGDLTLITGLSTALGAGTPLSTASVAIGDWMYIKTATNTISGTTAISPLNSGFFKVLEILSGSVVVIDNPNATHEQATAKIDFLAYNSIIPGDTVSFGTSLWGTQNMGSRLATALGATEYEFVLDTSSTAMATQGAVATPLGTDSGLFQVTTAKPDKRLLRMEHILTPNGSDSMNLVFYSFDTTYINEAFGTSIIPLNKLNFPVAGSSGRDSYKANTGLIAEANRIVFGDETNSSQYEGISSAGASYNINGPLVKRIQIALTIRPMTGVSIDSVRESVQSAVAAAINKSFIGTPIPISEIVKAAQSVNGVNAVSVSSPTYNVGQDLIAVQPYEKALVLDIENDITVTFIGE